MAHVIRERRNIGCRYSQMISGAELDNVLELRADMSATPWYEKALHRLLDITGVVHLRIPIYIAADVVSTTEDIVFEGLGTATDTDAYYTGATAETNLVAGNILDKDSATPVTVLTPTTSAVWEGIVAHDIFYELTGTDDNTDSGTIVFTVFWSPVTSDGVVRLGDGAAS